MLKGRRGSVVYRGPWFRGRDRDRGRDRGVRRGGGGIMNWFKARGVISMGSVEGLNNKIKVVTRKSYGFRTFKAAEVELYHTLGDLPEPESTHRFC